MCESGVSEASCSLLLTLLYEGSLRLDRQARVDGKVLLCLSKVVRFFPEEAVQEFGASE